MPGSRAFASGRESLFECDRCGLRGKYIDSVVEQETRLRVHERCLDEPLRPWKARNEPQALRDPRPDHYEAVDPDDIVFPGESAPTAPWNADSTFVTADSSGFTADSGGAS